MYDLGALSIQPQSWPDAWTARADAWLRRVPPGSAGSDAPVVTIEFAGHGLSPEDARPTTVTSELLREQRAGPAAWELKSAGLFVARLDEDARRLVIRARSEDDDPLLSLGNVLRGLMATSIASLRGGLMIHACAGIVHEGADKSAGAGVVVAGLSTAGKTTLALDLKDTTYLSDDVALVVDAGSAPTLVPSPFFGAVGVLGADARAPLRAIGVLVEKVTAPGAHSSYERVSRTRGAFEILQHVARFTDDKVLSARLFTLATELAARVPVVLVRRSLADDGDAVMRAVMREAGC